MKIYINLNEDNYVESWGTSTTGNDDEKEIEIESDHEILSNPAGAIKYKDDKLKLDEEKLEELREEAEEAEEEEDEVTPEKIKANEKAILELSKLIGEIKEGGEN